MHIVLPPDVCTTLVTNYRMHRVEECCRDSFIYFMRAELNQTKTCQQLSSSMKKNWSRENLLWANIKKIKAPTSWLRESCQWGITETKYCITKVFHCYKGNLHLYKLKILHKHLVMKHTKNTASLFKCTVDSQYKKFS